MASLARSGCIQCDWIVDLRQLDEGQRASCPRCGHQISVRVPNGQTRSLAFAISAAALLVISNSLPFLELRASGFVKVMTLPQSAVELYQDGYLAIAFLVLGPIVAVPALMLAAIVALLLGLKYDFSTPWLVPTARMLFALNPWSMVEVFLIGVLVSLVKIGSLATVVFGVSFWSYVGFAFCFIAAVSSLDRYSLWREIEAKVA